MTQGRRRTKLNAKEEAEEEEVVVVVAKRERNEKRLPRQKKKKSVSLKKSQILGTKLRKVELLLTIQARM